MANMETNSDERKIIDRVLHRDMVFRYQLLGRLQADCEYYLITAIGISDVCGLAM